MNELYTFPCHGCGVRQGIHRPRDATLTVYCACGWWHRLEWRDGKEEPKISSGYSAERVGYWEAR